MNNGQYGFGGDPQGVMQLPVLSATAVGKVTGIPIGALLAYDSDQSANVITNADGSVYLKTGVVAPSTTYPLAPSAPYGTVQVQANSGTLPPDVYSVAYGNGVFVASAGQSGLLYASTDCFTWTAMSVGLGVTATILFANGQFTAISGNGAATAVSTNGVNWVNGSLPNSIAGWQALSYGNGVWVAALSGSSTVATSTNGLTWTDHVGSRTWTSYVPASTSYNQGPGIAFGLGLFVLVDQTGVAAQLSTSPDGVNWTNRAMTAPTGTAAPGWYGIAFGNNTFIITQNATNGIQISTNGTSWTPAVAPTSPNANTSVAFLNGNFIYCNADVVATSLNGISWNTITTTMLQNGSVYASNGSTSVALQYNGTVGISYDSIHWWNQLAGLASGLTQMSYGNGKFLLSALNSPVAFSNNGTNWLLSTSPQNATNSYIQYFNGQYCLVSGISSYTSPDLITWTQGGAVPVSAGTPLYVAGKYMFIGQSTPSYNYTIDGVNWLTGTFPFVATVMGIAYGNGVYVAIFSTATMATSPDGINWTAVVQPPFGAAAGIVFSSGVFSVVFQSGIWYTSPSGATGSWSALPVGYGGMTTSIYNVMTDGTRVIAIGSGFTYAVWNGTSPSYAVRTSSVAFVSDLQWGNGYTTMNPLTGVIAGHAQSANTVSTLTMFPVNYVINDTNLKTYNATPANQTNLYKRVA